MQVQTKYKLPTLNWIALKPNQVRGTIFNELDDDRLHSRIDFMDFEERFKIGMCVQMANGTSEIDGSNGGGLHSFPSKRFKKPENVSLLEHTRLRNIGKSFHPFVPSSCWLMPPKRSNDSASLLFCYSHLATQT